MPDFPKLVESVVSGLLAGGASGASTLWAWGADLKKRLIDVEAKVGQSEDPKTGLFHHVWSVEETLKRFKREVEGWEEDPPDWAKRMTSKVGSKSSQSLEQVVEVERRIDQKIRAFSDKLKDFEEALADAKVRLKRMENDLAEDETPDSGKLITRDEYERDSKIKAEELGKIRESLASTNGLLRGVLAAMGYLDEKKR